MKPLRLVLAVVVLGVMAGYASAQSITWTSGFPKTGAVSKTIAVAGTITLPGGWSIKDAGPTIRFVPDASGSGGVVRKQPIMRSGNSIPDTSVATSPALTASAEYWVEMEITVSDGTKDYVISTIPKKATAK